MTCAACGLTTAEYQEAGLLGCAECYRAFAELLRARLPELVQVARQANRPAPAAAAERENTEAIGFQIDVLERELQDAVAMENFERAATLRDEITRLKTSTVGA